MANCGLERAEAWVGRDFDLGNQEQIDRPVSPVIKAESLFPELDNWDVTKEKTACVMMLDQPQNDGEVTEEPYSSDSDENDRLSSGSGSDSQSNSSSDSEDSSWSEATTKNLLVFVVGPNKVKITVSRQLARYHSPYLKEAIAKLDKHAVDKSAIALKHEDADAFDLFKAWLHRKYHEDFDASLLLKAYDLGDKLKARAFRNFVIDQLFGILFPTHRIPPSFIEAMEQQSGSTTLLRRLILDLSATKWRASISAHTEASFSKAFLFDLVKTLAFPRLNAKLPNKRDITNRCKRYHEHDEANNPICYTPKPSNSKGNFDTDKGEWSGVKREDEEKREETRVTLKPDTDTPSSAGGRALSEPMVLVDDSTEKSRRDSRGEKRQTDKFPIADSDEDDDGAASNGSRKRSSGVISAQGTPRP